MDPIKNLKPALLAKIGSILGHVQELRSPYGNEKFDGGAIDSLLQDPEVVEWMGAMRSMSLIPRPRNH